MSLWEEFKVILRFHFFRVHSFFWVLKEYVCCPSFARIDITLFLYYSFSNPYRLCRDFWEGMCVHSMPYGETPLRTWSKICQEMEVKKKDTILDLGSGRGRLLFWSLSRLGCQVVGVEMVPHFVHRSRCLVEFFGLSDGASFLLGDLCSAPFGQATAVYFYASLSDEDLLCDLAIWLSSLSHRPLIVTVGQKLSDYIPSFLIEKEIEGEFGWGKTSIYFQRYRDNSLTLSNTTP
ncbi:SAM-dependent methyltransferase [Candidatus Similichlamydia laticola]|uniref:DOT1 domain-containing protein n=1 Tax=Candidatus Similichlamydia laticola TaxID=2170265 RepID=A0A369KKF6_9BACT|nr:class I SAM-dependent methyltransferase [Candidatus Similichlamydia laticola]RDB31486.1 hypothetical protein HAT2_00412 [Candidatus Similichlamydia laticola]